MASTRIDKVFAVGFKQLFRRHHQRHPRRRCVRHWMLQLDRTVCVIETTIDKSRPLYILENEKKRKKKEPRCGLTQLQVQLVGASTALVEQLLSCPCFMKRENREAQCM